MEVGTIHIHTDLVNACKRGDRSAQYRMYQLYARAMFNICLRMLGDRPAAEDALQEAFVNVFRNIHLFEGRSSLGAWIKRIVVNKCLSHIRSEKMTMESLEGQHEHIPDTAEHPMADLPELTPERINRAIAELPEGCRVVFTLFQLEGYDHQEIADILNVSVSTSKSQLHRAKKLLHERLLQDKIRQ
ncbi:MAG: RNA polymerase sigma factor [Bacteroidia bacterium]|nr:RNA polymerase sigma factor [Bacteroidia bacterium]